MDLALVADVSSRHISCLETGRSRPSEQMVRWLAEALDVPLRDRSEFLRAAGFTSLYPEPDVNDVLAGPVGDAVRMMPYHHEPFPAVGPLPFWPRLLQTAVLRSRDERDHETARRHHPGVGPQQLRPWRSTGS